MSKTITVKDGGYLLVEDFKDFIDVDKIAYYALKHNKDGTLTIKFYDKKKKLIKVNEQK